MAISKQYRRERIKMRIRKRDTGLLPRLSVFRSNKEIYAQIVNDAEGKTLVAASSKEKEFEVTGTKTEKAKAVGTALAERAKEAKVARVFFDRNGYLYHGRVKALADAAREAGLIF
ncbi:MAG: 50S ribosomal protein L18 [Bacteroidales bacterium]|jgi:large subunit ribosomal protein L18|nr:50S ribosomal protein L18 [Bacteroidales bacterium]